MTKELAIIDETDGISADEVSEAGRILRTGVHPAPSGPGWHVESWNGHPVWACDLCPWRTMRGEDAIQRHITLAHGVMPGTEGKEERHGR